MALASRGELADRSAKIARTALAAAVVVAGLLSGSCASTPPPPPPPPPPPSAAKSVSPEALAGNWLLEVKVGSRTLEGGLHFANSKGVLAGTWTSADGNEYELKKISIDGDQISWDVDGPSGSQHATGKIDGLAMKGTMKRAARRRGDRSGSADGSGQGDPTGDSGEPPRDGATGGRSGGGRGGRGGGGRRGGTGAATGITWSAWKTMPPAGESAPPPPPPATPSVGL
jgi:hypothetical protein